MLNKRKTISKRYAGDLAKPIVRKRPTPPANRFFNPTFDQIQKRYETECDAEKRKAVDEFFRRIDLLWDRFDIEPGNWKALAISLAHEHVPGLQFAEPVQPARRQRLEWTIDRFRLRHLISKFKKARSFSGSPHLARPALTHSRAPVG